MDIDDRRDELAELLEADKAQAKAFWEKLDISWVYHENALEGIVITPEEMNVALTTQAEAGVHEIGKLAFLSSIRRQKEAIDVAKEEARNLRGKVSLTLIKKLFETLTGGEEGKGKMEFRRDMPLHRTYFHDIAQPPKIVPELTALIDWANGADFAQLTPIQQAALFHHRFMRTFPFTDLSGKVGRLLMNIFVMRAGYLPAVIHGIDRQRYYESLKQQPSMLQLVVTEAIEHATGHGLRFFSQAPAPETKWYKAG